MSESLRVRIDRLLTMMEKNERDRELSPYWKWGDGRQMNRAEWEAQRAADGMDGWPGQGILRDFHGEPIAEQDA